MNKVSTGSQVSQPRILVSGSLDSPFASNVLNCAVKEFADSAMNQLAAMNAQARFVNAVQPDVNAENDLSHYDGLLVLGGGDIDPANFGQTDTVDTLYGVNPAADTFELALIRQAMARNMPVLGICRGMQVLNVACGGSLFQEIGRDTMHYVADAGVPMTAHPVRVLDDTKLADALGEGEFPIRSGHHQAVDRPGNGLRVSAAAADGMVEAVEASSPDQWAIGVQWHPEDPVADPIQFANLFGAFVAECSAHAAESDERQARRA